MVDSPQLIRVGVHAQRFRDPSRLVALTAARLDLGEQETTAQPLGVGVALLRWTQSGCRRLEVAIAIERGARRPCGSWPAPGMIVGQSLRRAQPRRPG